MNDKHDTPFKGDAVAELTPAGRMTWEQFLSDCSAHAGRDITGDDISAILKQIRVETGERNFQFTEPVIELFIRHLEELRRQ